MVYKELWLGWWIRLHKTKRLHRFNFGLHRWAFRLHKAARKFTYIGLHVYACGLFCWHAWKLLYTRAFRAYRGFIYTLAWTVGEWHKNDLQMRFEERGEKRTKKGDFERVDVQVDVQTGCSFWKRWMFKTLAKPPPVERLPANKKGGISARNWHFASNFLRAAHLIIYRD